MRSIGTPMHDSRAKELVVAIESMIDRKIHELKTGEIDLRLTKEVRDDLLEAITACM